MVKLKEKAEYSDVAFVAISLLGSKDMAESFIKSTLRNTEAPFPVLYKGRKTQRAFGGRGTPNTFIMDRQGQLRFKHIGFTKGLGKTFELELKFLLEEAL